MKTWVNVIIVTMIFVTAIKPAFADSREFRPGRGSHAKGNERSERVRSVRVDRLSHLGNGCPEGTMRVAFAPDNLSFTVLYDQFVAEVTGDRKAPRDRMQCTSVIPVEIPEGMQMEIARVDYRGFAALPEKSQARLQSIVSFQSGVNINSGKTLSYSFAGPLMDTYEISTGAMNDSRGRANRDVSPCGGMAQLRISNQLSIRAMGDDRQAMITLDSIDGNSNMIYYVNWTQCRRERLGRGSL